MKVKKFVSTVAVGLSMAGFITSKSTRAFLTHLLLLTGTLVISNAKAESGEPIAYIGHGGFFSANGRQIEVTQDFVENAQEYYRQRLLETVKNDKKASLIKLEKNALKNLSASRQDGLVLQNRILASIAPASNHSEISQIRAKLNALNIAMQVQIPEGPAGLLPLSRVPVRKFVLSTSVQDILKKQSLISNQAFLASTGTGKQYLEECRSNGVPIPPPMGKLDSTGKAGWRSLGYIPKDAQFIEGTPAEVRVFLSDNPVGMCFALPRYVDDSLQAIKLDGTICLGQISSKVCFWDNQMPITNPDGTTSVQGFVFGVGEQIPIGVADINVDPKGRYQAGGAEIENGTGGVCTNCHAGENPYIIHPKVDLGNGLLMGKLKRPPLNLPMSSTNRYDPLVGISWPQNNFSMSEKLVPEACSSCHGKDEAGRFPLLSTDLKNGYCGILNLAIENTMPPSKPGSLKDDAEIIAFLKRCDDPPSSANADSNP